jgi:hypothetical protein
MLSPEKYAKAGSEHAHQVALFMWAAMNREKYPELEWMFAIPNGGERNGIVAARMKAEGVRSGVSDIMLPTARGGFHGLFIEMKKPGGKESENQKRFGSHVGMQGYLHKCCDSWEIARDLLVEYLES